MNAIEVLTDHKNTIIRAIEDYIKDNGSMNSKIFTKTLNDINDITNAIKTLEQTTRNSERELTIKVVRNSVCLRGFKAQSHYCFECIHEDNCDV